jgi:hypothetical protein
VNLLFSSLIWQLYISNSYLKHKFCISMQIMTNISSIVRGHNIAADPIISYDLQTISTLFVVDISNTVYRTTSINYWLYSVMSTKVRDRRGPDHMVVGFTTTYAISAYHHWCCEFETWSGRGVQHYVIKFVSDLGTGQWFSPGPPVSSTNKSDHHDITEILFKVVLNTIKQTINKRNNSYILQGWKKWIQSNWCLVIILKYVFAPFFLNLKQ